MSDFDTRLRERLEGLDAAIPAPRGPSKPTPTGRPADVIRLRSAAPRRGHKLTVLAAAAVLVLVASAAAATAQVILRPDDYDPEPALTAALQEVFAGDCLPATAATAAIQGKLDALGKADWVIELRPGAAEASCVVAFTWAERHAVVIMPGISRDVEEAMELVAEELLRQCLGREDAIELVSAALKSVGADDFVVRANPGLKSVPTDRSDEYRRHVEDGCFVYVGMPTREADGTAIHGVWGPGP